MTPGALLTFGYARLRGPDALGALLAPHGVGLVVDVRLRRASRLPGWSRPKALVEASGHEYAWAPGLGNELYRSGGVRLADVEQVEPVIDRLRHGINVAIFCACARVDDCHRRVVADEIVRRLPDVEVTHL
jgi:uncharacterized protein (DUF488 family)